MKDYVVLQKPQEQADRLPPPRTLILDFTMTHTRYDRSLSNLNGQLTNTRCSDGAPEPDGSIKVVVRKKILHYRQLSWHFRPHLWWLPTSFIPACSPWSTEESDHFRFFRAACWANIKWSVGLILAKASVMRISIPFDLSSRPFIPPSSLLRSRDLQHS